MKAGRLIEALKLVSPDTEVMCGVTIEDTRTLLTVNLFDLERTQKYEVKSVLTKPNDDKYCTLLIKRNGGIKMRFETLSEYDDEIKKIDKMIDSWEKYIKTHPEEIGVHTNCEGLKYIRNELKKERDNLEFYKATQEAFDRCDDSKGMSVEEFLKELDSW